MINFCQPYGNIVCCKYLINHVSTCVGINALSIGRPIRSALYHQCGHLVIRLLATNSFYRQVWTSQTTWGMLLALLGYILATNYSYITQLCIQLQLKALLYASFKATCSIAMVSVFKYFHCNAELLKHLIVLDCEILHHKINKNLMNQLATVMYGSYCIPNVKVTTTDKEVAT